MCVCVCVCVFSSVLAINGIVKESDGRITFPNNLTNLLLYHLHCFLHSIKTFSFYIISGSSRCNCDIPFCFNNYCFKLITK